jgi:hypothetical protein
MNPPFGKRNGLVPWLEKFFTHGKALRWCLTARPHHGGSTSRHAPS